MKKIITFSLCAVMLLITCGSLTAQTVTFKMKRPPLNQLKSSDLWSATIINSGEAFTAYLYGSMTNSENGELIATGQTMTFEVKKGTTNFKVSDLPRIPDINYIAKDPKYKTSFMNTGGAPSGDYKICCELRYTNNTVAGDDCFDQKIAGGDAPQLISPRDGEEIRVDNPVFTWMHMKGPGSTQTYTLRIVELKGDESPENAMTKRKAFFEQEGIANQLFQYPISASKFEPGKKYVWQVKIGDLKSEMSIFDRWGNLKNPPTNTNKSLPTFCTDFENNTISNWIMYNNFNSSITTSTDNLNTGSTGYNSTHGLNITDESGSTFIYNGTDFAGDYTQKYGSCLCFDFKLENNEPGAIVFPRIFLVQNFNTNQAMSWGTNPQLAASFTSSVSITQSSGWVHICAPIAPCSGGVMPSNSDGSWQMMNNGSCNDWTSLLSNVSGLMFSVDMSGWGGTEIFDIDNVCITNCSHPNSSNPCDSLKAVLTPSPLQGCCWGVNLTGPANTTGISGVQFLAQSPNSFVTGSSHIGSAYSSGWFFPVTNGQEFKAKKLGGNIPSGQLNGFFNFCLNKLSSPQHVIVNWLNAGDTVLCSDTVTTYCEIPCVTFTKDTLVCNGSNYNLRYSFTNNASFPIGKIDVVSATPSAITVSPSTLTLSPALNTGLTTNQPAFTLSGAVPNTQACIVYKFTSPDGCCWCYDTLCIVVPSCVCNEVGATITGDPLNCCYSLNLQNNYSANYFNQINIRPLESGVSFSTWNTNTSNNWYSINNYPDNVIYIINNPANFPNSYIPSGNSNSVINFCLHGYTTSSQHVVIEWMRNDSVKCRDTLATNCSPLPAPTNCTQLINDSLTCLPNGTYQYTFHIRNNSSHTTTGFQFNPVSPSGLTFTPANFSNVTIAPGMISPQQSMIIGGVSPGSSFCFKISLYEHILIAGQQYYDWCCYSDTICKTAPTCSTGTSCNYGATIDSITCKQNAAGPQQYNIWARVNNPNSVSTTLGSITASNGTMSCSPTTLPPGITNINCVYTVTGTPQNNPCFIFRIVKPGVALNDTCQYEICKPLPICTTSTGCNCNNGKWDLVNNVIRYSSSGVSTDNVIACNNNYSVDAGTAISLFSKYNCNTSNCTAQYTYRINGGAMTSFQASPYNISSITSSTSIKIYAWCGNVICDSCSITVNPKVVSNCNFAVNIDSVKCKQNAAGQWGYAVYTTINNPGITTATLNSVLVNNGSMTCSPTALAPGVNHLTCNYAPSGTLVNPVCFTYRLFNHGSTDTCKYKICRDLPNCNSTPTGCNITAPDSICYFVGDGFISLAGISVHNFPGTGIYTYTLQPYPAGSTGCTATINSTADESYGQPFVYFPSSFIISPPCKYKLTVTRNGCTAEKIFTIINCNQTPKCDCGEWKSKEIQVNINDKKAHPLMCGDDLEIKLNDLLILTFPEFICKPKDCNATYSWDLNGGSGTVPIHISSTDIPFKHEFTTPGLYTLSYKAYCGGKVCDSCVVIIKVNPGDIGNCDCGVWFKDKKGFTIHSSTGSPGVSFEKFMDCGSTSKEINEGVIVDLVSQQYICKPKDCNASYTWRITTPSGVNTTYNSQTVSNFLLNETGLYTIYVAPSCGGKVCDECVSYLKVVKINY